jgi:hypothetical protein
VICLTTGITAPQELGNDNEWSQAPCLMTSLPVAPARTTLVEAPHPGDPNGRIAAVRVPVQNDVLPPAGDRVEPPPVGPPETSELLRVRAPAEVSAEVSAGVNVGRTVVVTVALTVGQIVVLVAGRIAKAHGVARCSRRTSPGCQNRRSLMT